jgi:NAD(P)-dependent dehydrogenase (short-subunit alcohol dehydrogenase family)
MTTSITATQPQSTIVISGCSSGFGRITALELAQRGWLVFATVRQAADQTSLLADAAARNCQNNLIPLLCDITQADQIAQLAQTVSEQISTRSQRLPDSLPALSALLNNAGTAYGAPLELLPLADFRAQLEINVVAHLAMTQAFLPMLKAAKGTIINVSSVSGRFTSPINGAYSVSKFALEALSDTFRIELAPFGVRVVLIQPASSPTNIWDTSLNRSEWLNQKDTGLYNPLIQSVGEFARRSGANGFPPQIFADTVVRILNASRPRFHYPIPFAATLLILLNRLLPAHIWDGMLRNTFKW